MIVFVSICTGTNPNSTMLRLILLDVNDNAPIMPELQPTISENANVGDKIVSGFYAPDIDDPMTPNAQVEYRIVSVVAGKSMTSSQSLCASNILNGPWHQQTQSAFFMTTIVYLRRRQCRTDTGRQ